ncbi:MAG: hypothetical protein HRU20_17735 [Pseudomonadales bacterium]|nr:hypothetical protein [Pseudomonadales bacterium]
MSSLRGTQVDRADVVDAQGDFVLRPAILMYFDHFLSLRGEMSDDVIEQLILADIRRHYPAPIADQLTALFYRYRVYLIAISGRLAELSFFTALLQGVTQDSLEQEFQAEFFSEQEIDALFVAYKKMLSFRSAAKKFDTKYQRYQDVLQADPLQQEAILIQEFGIEAANRMMLLSDKRQRWQRRLKAYRAEKTLIMHSEHLDDYGKKEAVELLLQRSFDVSEQHRVEALNR